eukprot:CAMPEP_0184459594 /NCGR_PEP_ID=MMETSP0740-20130409/37520_1 /TAXON_ID=385413 /ORGANISM="Thalassiosira miniscula, Strain CCMP1093" /LENGTH=63 /DNA_ID=CAMNT_0026832637 /DNA_START=9 /DNA_END=196 /DNA_ORIENTATION=-
MDFDHGATAAHRIARQPGIAPMGRIINRDDLGLSGHPGRDVFQRLALIGIQYRVKTDGIRDDP